VVAPMRPKAKTRPEREAAAWPKPAQSAVFHICGLCDPRVHYRVGNRQTREMPRLKTHIGGKTR
jgi:hypothetical protein